MCRKVIDLREENLTFEEIDNLKDYVWKGNFLIPVEKLEGE